MNPPLLAPPLYPTLTYSNHDISFRDQCMMTTVIYH